MGFISITPEIFVMIRKLGRESENHILDYITDKALQEFCRMNQFYSINKKAQKGLRAIYSTLLQNFQGHAAIADKGVLKDDNDTFIETVSRAHFSHLQSWLKETNPFSILLNPADKKMADRVTCAEYSAGLQLNLFGIDLATIKGPVLDIGSGKKGLLVNYLRHRGVEAYGIDRFTTSQPFLQKSDWLDYTYEEEKWGTIISHLGFTNHFEHHNQRKDGNIAGYAQTYMSILRSLKGQGSFYYAPNLPYIEQYLENESYRVDIREIDGLPHRTAKVTRIGLA
ncbi:hypothetical protein ACX0G9_22130 [Flavitalea flava]